MKIKLIKTLLVLFSLQLFLKSVLSSDVRSTKYVDTSKKISYNYESTKASINLCMYLFAINTIIELVKVQF